MGQLQQLSDSLERARSQDDAATAHLANIQRDLKENKRELHVAKHNLSASQRTVPQRRVALYNSDQQSTPAGLPGSQSLHDLPTRQGTPESIPPHATRA